MRQRQARIIYWKRLSRMTRENKRGSAVRMTSHILERSTWRSARETKTALIRIPNQTRHEKGLAALLSGFTEDFFGLGDILGDLMGEFLKGFEGLFVSQTFDEVHFHRFAYEFARVIQDVSLYG